MTHILVVDDEPRIVEIVRDYLEQAGFAVTAAGTGSEALALVRTRRPDLIVLDIGLPRMNGWDVARAIRKESNVPILMLTARVDERDKLMGLEIGADDYMTKPFSPRELVARVRAIVRRVQLAPEKGDVLHVGALTLDRTRLQVRLADRVVDLTATEYELVATLAGQRGRVFTRAQLLDAIRGDRVESFDRAIDAHIKNVRRKLETDPREPRHILTVHGVGYKFVE